MPWIISAGVELWRSGRNTAVTIAAVATPNDIDICRIVLAMLVTSGATSAQTSVFSPRASGLDNLRCTLRETRACGWHRRC
jgi:hypothetical protein